VQKWLNSDYWSALQPPVSDLAAPLQVAADACHLIRSGTNILTKATKQLKAGDLNFCLARGCIRSLQDVLVTLMRHMSLLLKEIVLRLDFWNDLHDSQWRIRVSLLCTPRYAFRWWIDSLSCTHDGSH
jgi:hypothetical protein